MPSEDTLVFLTTTLSSFKSWNGCLRVEITRSNTQQFCPGGRGTQRSDPWARRALQELQGLLFSATLEIRERQLFEKNW